MMTTTTDRTTVNAAAITAPGTVPAPDPGGDPASATPPAVSAVTTPATAPTYWTETDSPIGPLLLTADPDGALTSLSVRGRRGGRAVQDGRRRDPGPFREAEAQLAAYFAGEREEFRLPLRTRGTDFRERVWAALDAVPYGATTTYGAIAARVGASRAAVRAVGGAIGANPLLVLRPCHRVIGADGSLTGYSGGLARKIHLLALEGVPVRRAV